jgi:hypothetical protein
MLSIRTMKNWLLTLVALSLSLSAFSQANLFYRTRFGGEWSNPLIWETSASGGNPWSVATVPPNSTSSTVTVRHAVLVSVTSGAVTVDQLALRIGSSITISVGGALTVLDGSGTDFSNTNGTISITGGSFAINGNGTNSGPITLSSGSFSIGGSFINNSSTTITLVSGTFTVSGTFANAGTLSGSTAAITTFTSTGRYRATAASTTVPLATWNSGSTFEVAGFTGSATISNSTWNQAFSNVEINLTGLTNSTRVVNFNSSFTSVLNNLTVISTGGASGGKIALGSAFIGGNLTTSASTRTDFSTDATNQQVNLVGSLINSGTLTMANSTGTATLNIQGNISVPSGGILTTNGGSSGAGIINFNRTGLQVFAVAGTVSNRIHYNVTTNSILDVGTSALTGTGNFTLSGEIRLGSTDANGALQTGSAAGSNIQNLGSRTYNSGSTITYNAGSAQYIGNGHPGVVSPGVNLTMNTTSLDYAAAVTLLRVTGDLTFQTNGSLNIGPNQMLTLDGDLNNSGNGTITVTSTSDLVINGSGAFGTFPFPAGDQTLRTLTLSRTAGSLTLANNLTVNNTLTLDEGNLIFNSMDLVITGNFSANSGLFYSNASSTLYIGGIGAFGTFAFAPGGATLNTLTLDRTGGTATVSGSLTVTSAIHLVNGDLSNAGGLTLNNGATIHRYANGALVSNRIVNAPGDVYNVRYLGAVTTGLELPDAADDEDLNNLTINGGPVILSQDVIVNGNFTFNASAFSAGSQTITMQGAGWLLSGGIFIPGTGTVIFDGITTITGAPTFNHLQLNATRTLTLPAGTTTVGANITFASSAILNHGSGTVLLNGAGTQTVDANSNALYVVEVSKAGGDVVLSSGLGIARLLDIQSGTIFNSSGNLQLLSTGEATENDASIGPLLNGAAVTGNVIKQRFMSAKGIVNRYISSPLDGVSVSQLQDDFAVTGSFTGTSYPCTGCATNGASLRYYRESVTGAVSAGYLSWPTSSNAQTLEVGRGYLAYMWVSQNLILDQSASINSGTISLPVTYTTTSGGVSADGWNLVGNPYPSAIIWDGGAGWTINNIDPTISVPDLGAGGEFPTYFKTYNYTDDSGNLPGGIIASGQAFWVHASSPASPSLVINENAKTSAAGGMFYRSATQEKSRQLIVSINDGKFEDNAFLKLNSRGTDGFDNGLDAIKLKNESMNIFMLDKEGKELVMNTLKEISENDQIRIGIEAETPGQYNIVFHGHEGFEPAAELYLFDRQENQSVPVTAGVSYSFNIAEGRSVTNDRFYLSKSKKGGVYETALVYPNPVKDFVNVAAPTGEQVSVSIYDASGAMIYHNEDRITDVIDMRNYARGVYVMKLLTSKGIIVKKITKQ